MHRPLSGGDRSTDTARKGRSVAASSAVDVGPQGREAPAMIKLATRLQPCQITRVLAAAAHDLSAQICPEL
jgi:hypothetical protein